MTNSNNHINSLQTESVTERFLRYVQIDTQSDPESTTFPSTEKQKNLGRLLVEELLELGVGDAHLDEYGYVYATIPSNSSKTNVPTVCFCSHMDTSPDCSGEHVKPIVHKNYQGQDLVLPEDTTEVIRLENHPDLKTQIGNDLITASGDTLLGADDKAGVAEIMTAVEILMKTPTIKHGEIKILFTPDEEIGRGVDYVDIKKLNADFAYTLDGERAGTIEDETFSADSLKLTIQGVETHPGFAKGKLENALKIASDILARLPKDQLSPETTSGKEGFIHPTNIKGDSGSCELDFILRNHDTKILNTYPNKIEEITKEVLQQYPNSSYKIAVSEQYRNMKEVLDQHPEIINVGIEAIKRAGMEPEKRSIRGGTDGARLSFMGLPCPNVFTGGHAFHSRQEWVSVQDMQKAIYTILHIANIWEEQA
ncbi:MAG TPA: peptidase T [Candidatus Sphingobacterium stercoripullorum]|uniref:Peptidase T n=1 Tax=Candidatus Sphingobacterium stercoripullorum TaxID=2838759 RepID=A0A9D2AY76_9SPHI|nr:peptidase T [Candidatus Sphingobacterium stercoripullorum]HLR49293.1 peptidase T [Candidatus Sphingobacterium stercoripullorum]